MHKDGHPFSGAVTVLTGVVGLVSLTVHRRSKEIGIRKVLGSSVPGILVLLSRTV